MSYVFAKCVAHREQIRVAATKRKAARKSSGLCFRCGSEKALENNSLCGECKDKKARWSKSFRKRRVSKGLCYICNSAPTIGKNDHRCSTCRDKLQNRVEERKSKNLCPICGTAKLNDVVRCFECWMKERAYHALGSKRHYKKLLHLWDAQKGCCAYTGVELIPGVTTHLDHKLPVSKGGKDEISNYQWLDKRINFLKDTQTHEEFISGIPSLIKLLEGVVNEYSK